MTLSPGRSLTRPGIGALSRNGTRCTSSVAISRSMTLIKAAKRPESQGGEPRNNCFQNSRTSSVKSSNKESFIRRGAPTFLSESR